MYWYNLQKGDVFLFLARKVGPNLEPFNSDFKNVVANFCVAVEDTKIDETQKTYTYGAEIGTNNVKRFNNEFIVSYTLFQPYLDYILSLSKDCQAVRIYEKLMSQIENIKKCQNMVFESMETKIRFYQNPETRFVLIQSGVQRTRGIH